MSFSWIRFIVGTLILTLWAGTLATITWLAVRGLFLSSWDWSYLIIIPLFALGLFATWVTFWIVLNRCKTWLRNTGFHYPRFRH